MKYTSLNQLPISLSAEDVAQVLGISRANAYVLMHSKGFPTIRIGRRMTVPKDRIKHSAPSWHRYENAGTSCIRATSYS